MESKELDIGTQYYCKHLSLKVTFVGLKRRGTDWHYCFEDGDAEHWLKPEQVQPFDNWSAEDVLKREG